MQLSIQLHYTAMTMALDSASNERPVIPLPFRWQHKWQCPTQIFIALLSISSVLTIGVNPAQANLVCEEIVFEGTTINTLEEDAGSEVTLIGHLPNRNYVVIVPGRKEEVLLEVRRYVPDAFQSSSRLGAYIHAGAFDNRSAAETLSMQLRACHIRSRVVYFRNGRPV